MANETINIPDLGSADEVDVIEISVKPGDEIAVEDTLLVLESDKASMDIPAPKAGVIKKVLVKVGDKVASGTAIMEVETSAGETPEQEKPEEKAPPQTAAKADQKEQPAVAAEQPDIKADDKTAAKSQARQETVKLPDLGTDDAVDVIEVTVSVGDTVAEGDALMTLESDKAAMDVPSPYSGKITKVLVGEGDKVKSGAAVAEMTVEAEEASVAAEPKATKQSDVAEQAPVAAKQPAPQPSPQSQPAPQQPAAGAEKPGSGDGKLNEPEAPAAEVYAGPMVRHFARELGVDLRNVSGSGNKSRITREDVLGYVNKTLATLTSASAAGSGGAGIPVVPDVDYSQFGEIEEVPLSRIAKLTAANMSRNWLNVPAVTQFDDADITDMEAFRKSLQAEADKRGVRLTPVAFILLACAHALRSHPVINRSWHSSGDKVIQKKFVHIGMAVDTPRGLLVPVIRDVDKKGLWELAAETAEVANKAREGKLSTADMQGGSFSISSLGAIGGRGFTPIVNSPEGAILGVSKASVQPVWNGSEFTPRQMLPLSLTYDHRLINGADAGRFLTDIVALLGDIRRVLL
ncbi:MAG: dihydrolipoyllysine-residue acetyltransferase, partial [Porticoccaceae bacterium]|nr:dihydrolipoyllysine-residue acetyltransferase [Porticoccaceae bacterium]